MQICIIGGLKSGLNAVRVYGMSYQRLPTKSPNDFTVIGKVTANALQRESDAAAINFYEKTSEDYGRIQVVSGLGDYPDLLSIAQANNFTSFFETDDETNVTADAQMRVSAFGDRLGLVADCAQSTNANKPLWSGTTNEENVILYSSDMSQSKGVEGLTSLTASAFLDSDGNPLYQILASATTNRHGLFCLNTDANGYTGGTGRNITFQCEVMAGTSSLIWVGDRYSSWHGTFFNISTETWGQEVNLTSRAFENLGGGLYRFTITYNRSAGGASLPGVYIASSTTGTSPSSFAAAGTETIFVGRWWHYITAGSPQYILTTAAPIHRGVNGRRWLVLNGAQRLDSTSTLANIITTSSGLIYIVLQSFLTNVAASIFNPNGQRWTIDTVTTGGGSYRFQTWDGAVYKPILVAGSPNIPTVLRARFNGGSVYLAQDTGAGFGAESTDTASNIDLLTGVLRIGATSAGFYGKLAAFATKNDGTPVTDFETGLRAKYLTQPNWKDYSISVDGEELLALTRAGNMHLFGASDAKQGRGVLPIANSKVIPQANPDAGGILFVENGALKYRGSSGTVTTIANA
jgi:hypothetical protein